MVAGSASLVSLMNESPKSYTVRLGHRPGDVLERYAEVLAVSPEEAAGTILTDALEGWVRRKLDPREKAHEDREDDRPWPW